MFHSLTVAARPSSTDETFEEQLQREESEGASLFAAPGRNSGSAGNAARERRERDRGESDLLCALCCLSCRSSEPPSPARVKRLSTAAVPVLGDQRWQTVIEACHWFCAPRDGSLRLGKLSGTRLDRLRAAALDAFQRALMSLPPSAPYAQLQEQAIEVARQKWEQTRSSALSRVSADGRLCCLTDTELAEMSRSAAAAQKALLQAWQQALQWLERLSSAAGPLRCKLQAIVWMMARRPEFEHASILFELYLRPGCGADDGNVAPVRQQMRLAVRRYRHLLLRTLQLALRQVEQCARTALVAPAALSFSRRGSRAIISDEPLLQNPSVLFAGRLLGHATFLSSAVAAHIGRSLGAVAGSRADAGADIDASNAAPSAAEAPPLLERLPLRIVDEMEEELTPSVSREASHVVQDASSISSTASWQHRLPRVDSLLKSRRALRDEHQRQQCQQLLLCRMTSEAFYAELVDAVLGADFDADLPPTLPEAIESSLRVPLIGWLFIRSWVSYVGLGMQHTRRILNDDAEVVAALWLELERRLPEHAELLGRVTAEMRTTLQWSVPVLHLSYRWINLGAPWSLHTFANALLSSTYVFDVERVAAAVELLLHWLRTWNTSHGQAFGAELEVEPWQRALNVMLASEHYAAILAAIKLVYDAYPYLRARQRELLAVGAFLQSATAFERLFLHWSGHVRSAFYLFLLYRLGCLPPRLRPKPSGTLPYARRRYQQQQPGPADDDDSVPRDSPATAPHSTRRRSVSRDRRGMSTRARDDVHARLAAQNQSIRRAAEQLVDTLVDPPEFAIGPYWRDAQSEYAVKAEEYQHWCRARQLVSADSCLDVPPVEMRPGTIRGID
ncbi:hypothetical protein CDCA_CDCA15G4088 [Cyanidium caldarium]|uniref:Uncharacterized protein n=1 Tax=Cyanidium caldarium TaxID=2771 RepID=A0AAV9J0F2_CYACA|nr:hypothetical protein CDCA_CDCA15G4088 [Cyanidium caldarium]